MLVGPKAISLYTVSPKSWYSGYWNTSPTAKRKERSFALSAHRSSSPMYILPEVGAKRPLKCWMRVDFPEPVWPMTPRNSP